MIWRIIILTLIVSTSPALADEAADKAEFKRLYAEFNDLYANSEAIDPIIEVAEKLYKLAPKAYGKKHNNTAVVTYNLASLYDEKGGEADSKEEKKAASYYKKYFDIYNNINLPKDKNYLEQFLMLLVTETNINLADTDEYYIEEALSIANRLQLNSLERANFEYKIGQVLSKQQQIDKAKNHFILALDNYMNIYDKNHQAIGLSRFEIAKIYFANGSQGVYAEIPPFLPPKTFKALLAKADFSEETKEHFTKAALELEEALRIFNINSEDNIELLKQSSTTLKSTYLRLGDLKSASRHNNTPKFITDTISVTPLERYNPEYPYQAVRDKKEGQIRISYTVGNDGRTKNIKVISATDEIFVENSLDVAKSFLFEPPHDGEKYVKVENIETEISFKLKDENNEKIRYGVFTVN